jgi:isopenicillin N synthase-like dioxygenase
MTATTAAAAAATTETEIPVIDLSLEQDQVVDSMMKALTTIGFATLINHGLPDDLLPKALMASKTFFDLPTDTKQKYKFQGSESNRGYIGIGSEFLDLVDGDNQTYMLKESLEIGKEDEPGFQNEWPDELKGSSFRDDLIDYFRTLDALNLRIMRLIGIGLKLEDPNYLVDRCNRQHDNLRLLHYPALSHENAKASRANLHTDYGTITLLAQDQVGGLQALTTDGTWIDVTPVENSIVMNVGEMLMRWSNDVLKATLHQVKAPPPASDGSGIPERYSIAFFCNPNKDTVLECLEPCCKDRATKYEPINAHDYITKRLSDTIQDPVKANTESTNSQ